MRAQHTLKRYDAMKRVFDSVLAVVGLVLSAPVLLVVAILVRRKLGSPVLFRQRRPGLDGRIFELVKFRSMLAEDKTRGLVSDKERLTRFGQILRSTSLDELPTLFNVLKGDMSMVGPRPLLERYLELYSPQQRRRHEVRPGITGLAQVKGRNSLSWEDKFALDVLYVDKRSFALDVKILFETVRSVALRRGINAEGNATAPEFLGSSAAAGAMENK